MEDQFDKIVAIASVYKPIRIKDDETLDVYNHNLDSLERLCHAVIASKSGKIERLPASLGLGDGFELSIPVDHVEALKELVDRSHKESGLHIVIPLGHDISEAHIASKYAQDEHVHDDVVVYHPDMQLIADDKIIKNEPDDTEDPIEHAKKVLADIKQNMQLYQEMREKRPEVYKAVVETLKSLIEAVADQKEQEEKEAGKAQDHIDRESQKRENKESQEAQREVESQFDQAEDERAVKPEPTEDANIVAGGIDPRVLKAAAEQTEEEEVGDRNYDPSIENGDYTDSDDPEFSKSLAYVLKYGKLYE